MTKSVDEEDIDGYIKESRNFAYAYREYESQVNNVLRFLDRNEDELSALGMKVYQRRQNLEDALRITKNTVGMIKFNIKQIQARTEAQEIARMSLLKLFVGLGI